MIGGVKLTKSEKENIQDLQPGDEALGFTPLNQKPQQTQVVKMSGFEHEFTTKLFADSTSSSVSTLTLSKMIEEDYFKLPGQDDGILSSD